MLRTMETDLGAVQVLESLPALPAHDFHIKADPSPCMPLLRPPDAAAAPAVDSDAMLPATATPGCATDNSQATDVDLHPALLWDLCGEPSLPLGMLFADDASVPVKNWVISGSRMDDSEAAGLMLRTRAAAAPGGALLPIPDISLYSTSPDDLRVCADAFFSEPVHSGRKP